MGLCINCIYHRNSNEITQTQHFGRGRGEESKIRLTHVCVHPNHIITDYITGETSFDSCYKWNGYDECLVFDDGKEPVPDEPVEPTNEPTTEPTEPTNEPTNPEEPIGD